MDAMLEYSFLQLLLASKKFARMRHFVIGGSPRADYTNLSESNFPQNRKNIYGTPERAEERDGQWHTTIDAFLTVFLFDSTQVVNYTMLK